MLEGCLHKLVLVVASVASREPLERWVFNVQREDDAAGCVVRLRFPTRALTHFRTSAGATEGKSDVSAQIAAIIRQVRCLRMQCEGLLTPASCLQITASVTFLPLLDEPCACTPSTWLLCS